MFLALMKIIIVFNQLSGSELYSNKSKLFFFLKLNVCKMLADDKSSSLGLKTELNDNI